MPKLLVGIGYKAKHGKSVVRDLFIEKCSRMGLSARNFSYSEYVLEFCKSSGLIKEDTARSSLSQSEIKILQDVGLQKRKEDPYFWIGKLMGDVSSSPVHVAIIDNLRYTNECVSILDTSFPHFLAKVDRYDTFGRPFVSPDRNPFHQSETELDSWTKWDFRLSNTRDLYWLRAQAIAMFDHLLDEVDIYKSRRKPFEEGVLS